MNKTQVVVLGRNYVSLLGMIRAVGYADCDVTVIKTVREFPKKTSIKEIVKRIVYGKPIEAASKYVKKYLYAVEPDREKLIELLLSEFEQMNEKVILIPTDDFTASTIDLYQDQLTERFIFPNIANEKGKIVEMMNKDLQKQLAIENELNVAKGYVIEYKEGKYEIPEGIVYPVFTKPQISFKGDKTLMRKCENEKELKELLNYSLKKYKCPILVEQFIQFEKEYAVLGLSYNDEIIIPGIIRMIKSGSGEHKGVTLLGEVSSLEKNKQLLDSLKKLIGALNFKGLFDIDLYEENGIIYFNELNLRFGASGYAITKLGVNLPQIFINKLVNKETSVVNKLETRSFVNEKVNLEDFEAGYIGWKDYKKTYENVDFSFIKSDDDPKPYSIFKRKVLYVCIKTFLKKIIRRPK